MPVLFAIAVTLVIAFVTLGIISLMKRNYLPGASAILIATILVIFAEIRSWKGDLMKSETIWPPMVLLVFTTLFVLAIIATDAPTNTVWTVATVTVATPTRIPTPSEASTNESNDGSLTGNRTHLASMLALGAFMLLAVGGAIAVTRKR